MGSDLALFSPVLEAPFFRDLQERLRRGERGLVLTGLVEGARALVLTLLAEMTGRKFLLIVPDDSALSGYNRVFPACAVLAGRDPRRIVVLPAMDADPYDGIAPHPEVVRERVVALGRLARGDVDIVLASARALVGWLPDPAELVSKTRTVRKGDVLPPDGFVVEAMRAGYRRVDIVSGPGEVSRRGGIVDIFPPGGEEPVRIEFFGDTVDSIRSFDTDHQRSTGLQERAVVTPAAENPPSEDALARLATYLEDGESRVREDGVTAREFRARRDQLQSLGYLPGLEALAGLTAERPVLLFEYAHELDLVVDEPERTEYEVMRAHREVRSAYEQSGDRILPPPARLYPGPLEVCDRLREARLFLQELAGNPPDTSSAVLHVASRSTRAYSGRLPELVEDLRSALGHQTRTLCVMRAAGGAERVGEILRGYDLNAAVDAGVPVDGSTKGGLFVRVAGLRSGFELPECGLTVLTERDLFGEEAKGAERRARTRAAFLSDFRDLRKGDLVVHVDHGIARYNGLGRPKGGSLNRDFMTLEFAGGDRLFVPVDRLDLVQKYSGVGGRRPTLDRLGGPGWEKVKAKVRRSVESTARELLELYARRKVARGFSFSPDSAWQKELEAAFPHELTSDQERAAGEVKEDMESSKPMDRLLVGDVGFGKTEVAVRAAFKAVMDGYQVALLAPTTVLAVQHHETFRERFAPFPIRVEMVSRFRTPQEIRKTLDAMESGEVDVTVGTHRLLSKDVRFRRLGLLVLDEEQRFGVADKERLKRLSVGIDVLAMTATPIPRTLQMSLAGVRDLSIIETPPPGRTAIQTYLIPFRRNVLAQAIRQELRRKGQVFVVHNRVETLPAMTRAVREMVPEARIAVGHGRMRDRDLERVMLEFVHYQADVLVTTAIIENGLDIPRANTIIVNRADRFGLAQLYQLRGRVGRSEEHAYAYFTIPSREGMSETARRRLRALQEFSELGTGFRLAAADLEIRGGGEFLGDRQHGHIDALGFDLYTQMLERAVQDLRGEPVAMKPPASLHLGVDIKVPESYMPDVGDRLALYKNISSARDEVELDRLQSDVEDRCGHLPAPGRNLLDLARLRLVAERAGVKSVDVADAKLQIRFHAAAPVESARIVEMLASEKGKLTPSGLLILPAPERASERIRTVRAVLEKVLGLHAA